MNRKILLLFTIMLMTVSAIQAQTPYFSWANTLIPSFTFGNGNISYSVATDASGNVYTTGAFVGGMDFDPGVGTLSLTSFATTDQDLYIHKVDASGNLVWVKTIGSGSNETGLSIAVDNGGNVYITGIFTGTVDFDPGSGTAFLTSAGYPSVSYQDMFILKLNSSGDFVWARRMGNSSNSAELMWSIDVDAGGNVYTTGRYIGTVDFDPGVGVADLVSLTSFDNDCFILKLNSSGNYVWAKSVGGTGYDFGYDITVDATGNVYTTGHFQNNFADFDPSSNNFILTAFSDADVFILKLNSTGNFVWAKGMGNSSVGSDVGKSIEVDALGNVYTAGIFKNTMDFDPGLGMDNRTSIGGEDVFIQKLDASGNYVWAKTIGSTSDDGVASLALDNAGNVYTTGEFRNTADFNPGTGTFNLTSTGERDIYIQKLDASGNFIWANRLGGPSWDLSYGIHVDNTGNIYSTGVCNAGADLNPTSGTYMVSSFVVPFTIKLNPTCPTTFSTINQTICQGNSYTFNGITHTTSGTYLDTLVNAAGCDSIVTLNLTVGPNSTVNQSICPGSSFSFNGQNLSTTGIYYDTLMSTLGCDSIITLNLTVLSPAGSTINQSICSGSSYTFNGQNISIPGTYYDTLVTANGCDSLITLNLSFLPTYTANLTNTIPSRCGEKGSIALSSISGYTFISSNNFSSAIASPYSTIQNAILNNGQLQLTAATNSQNGALIYTPTSTLPNGLTVSFDMDMYSNQAAGNSIADGMSFNYGVIPTTPTGNFEDGIVLTNTGLVLRLKTWQTQRVEVVYNGVVKATYDADLNSPMIRKVQLAITPAGLFSLRIGNNIVCTNLDLGISYATDNKSTWKIGWAARTGGSNNRHAIDNIEIMNNNGIQFTVDNWVNKTPLPFFSPSTGTYTVLGGSQACASTLGTSNLNFSAANFTSVANVINGGCNGRTVTISNTLPMDTLIWSDFATRPTLSNFTNLGNATFSNGSVQLTDNIGNQNGRIVFAQTPNAGVFTATFKARVWDGNNADGFSFNYGQIDNAGGADGGMMNTNTPGLSVCFPTWNTNNIIVKYKNSVLTTVPNTGSGGNRASFFTPIEVSVNAQYQLTVKWNGTTYISNYDLVTNSTYETDAKTNWQFAWGARTGGQFDRHQLDDILVTGKTGLLYSYDGGATYETNASKIISGTQAVNVVVKTDGICTPSTTNLAAITIPAFNSIASICSGTTLTLPTTSTNGILGSWSPAANNLATTTYTFTPTGGGCTTTMSVNVNPLPTITSVTASASNLCSGASTTLSALPQGGVTAIVSTFAGSSAGFVNGTGAAAQFNFPNGIATDFSGNFYVADNANHSIRKITPAGVVTTFAGNGTQGSANGTGTAASFKQPYGVATDANGNVYVTDASNHRIRKITPAGVVTTFAGNTQGFADGNGTAAQFNYPSGVATDANGNVYVADGANHRIRKITPLGVVTTIAGSGTAGFADGTGAAAMFYSPTGLAVDANGMIYVADNSNNRIRKITPSGVVTTFAGSTQGSADGTGTSAQFALPSSLTIDANGNLYVADYLNNRIRKITSSGMVTTLAGSTQGFANGPSSVALFDRPQGVTLDANGNVYVADLLNSLIRKITILDPVSYSWSPSVSGINAGMDSVLATPSTTTVYTVSATNANGCTASSTVSVIVNQTTTGSSTVSAVGSYVFNSITYTTSGTYTATFTNAAGCDSVHTLNLTIVIPIQTPPILSAGTNFSMYLCTSPGIPKAYGRNNMGQLGNGTTSLLPNTSPASITGLSDIIAVSAGQEHALYLKSDGTVWASGRNSNGQLGDGTTINRSTPVQVTTLTNIIGISAGYAHSIFLKNDGTVWSCGWNDFGQLGNGNTTDQNTPVQVSGLNNVVAVAGGGRHTLCLKNDGTVWGFGFNAYGQLGNNSGFTNTIPVQVSGLNNCTAIATGTWFSLFIKSDGTAWACGGNFDGQLGNGTTSSTNTLVQVKGPGGIGHLSNITAISGGGGHSLFLKNDGTVWATGWNINGQLGDGTTANKTTVIQVNGLSGITAIDGGSNHSVFMQSNGVVLGCGFNALGELGIGNTITDQLIAVPALQPTVPTFTAMAPVCAGATLTALPTASLNGFIGVWSPAINNLATTTYTFTPSAGQCGNTTTMTILVTPTTHTLDTRTECYSYTWPVNSVTYHASGIYTYTTGCHTDSLILTIEACKDIKVLIQGYYLSTSMMQPVLLNSGISAGASDCDSIKIELHEVTFPYNTMYSFGGILQTDGTIHCTYPEAVVGNNYYIVVKHRNSIDTWSANPELFQTTTTTYDFSSGAHMAYGSNQIQLSPTEWGIYSGDVNQDLFIDVFDYLILDGDLTLGVTGYAVTDITGDGAVDTFDYLILDGNITSGIGTVTP